MNVDNVLDSEVPTPTQDRDRLAIIFNRQHELMEKYHPIEAGNGLLQTQLVPVDIHDRFGQARLKDFAWRITEELTEASEAGIDHAHLEQHFLEELSDAFHFLVEFSLLAGITPAEIHGGLVSVAPPESSCRLEDIFRSCGVSTGFVKRDAGIYRIIYWLGCACNTLKNKPWKNSHMLTDVDKFRGCVLKAWAAFIIVASAAGMGADDLYRIYMKKSEVNKFRQRSNY